MRNFTSKKNGISLFLFFFILFSGTSSYGQTCPTVTDQNTTDAGNQQYFCDSEISEVQDLIASGTDIAWYSDQSSITPLPPTQLLADGTTYFAGTSTGTCTNTRVSVTVTIYSQPEILGINETTKSSSSKQSSSLSTLSFCVASIDNPDIFLSNIRTSADASGNIQWYDSQNSSTVLAPSTELVNGATYWVDQESPFTGCRTNRRSVKIILNSEPAPTGPATQVFCDANNPTLANIEVSGENRYFVSATSETELSSTTPLEDGKTYYIASVGTECVSSARLAVTVTVTPLSIIEETQGFCESGNPTVGDNLAPIGGTWYADATFTTPLDPALELEHAEDYFLAIEDGSCATTRVIADIFPAPNAGTTTTRTYCSNDPAINLFNEIEGTPDNGGTFDPPLTGNMFDPAEWGADVHEFTYTVTGNEFCADAVNTITVTVNAAPDAGADVDLPYCSADFPTGDDLIAEFNSFMTDRDQSGSFNPTLESLGTDYETNPIGTFSTTYTITNATTSCTDFAVLSITVTQTPDAGLSSTYQLIEGDNTVVDLYGELNGTPESGGVWTDESGATVSGNFDPAVDTAPATYTYTVTSNGCDATATVFVAEACPIVADTTPEFCAVIDDGSGPDFPRVSDLEPSHAIWYTSADTEDDTTIDPATELEDQGVYYAGNASGTCTTRTAVSVTILDTPNAGVDTDTPVEVCGNDPAFDLVSRIDPSILGAADTNGTFNPPLVSGGNTFDPAVDVSGTYTYTVPATPTCPAASAEIIVNVEAVPNAPVTTPVTDCAATGLTVADLQAAPDTGNTIQWYTDAARTTPAAETDVLVTDTYYATQVNTAGCESDAAPAAVVINDAPTPSMVQGGNVFCMVEQPTIGDITMNESGITWYDAPTGGNILSTSDMLQNEAVYYASLTNATTGCESSQRLAVTAELEKCPLPIPEAFSPNGDGINDRFVVDFMAQQYPNFTIKVFNRWGQTVFTGNASNNTWDGTSNKGSVGSDVLPVGVYFYVIEYNDGETTPDQGTLYLSR